LGGTNPGGEEKTQSKTGGGGKKKKQPPAFRGKKGGFFVFFPFFSLWAPKPFWRGGGGRKKKAIKKKTTQKNKGAFWVCPYGWLFFPNGERGITGPVSLFQRERKGRGIICFLIGGPHLFFTGCGGGWEGAGANRGTEKKQKNPFGGGRAPNFGFPPRVNFFGAKKNPWGG